MIQTDANGRIYNQKIGYVRLVHEHRGDQTVIQSIRYERENAELFNLTSETDRPKTEEDRDTRGKRRYEKAEAALHGSMDRT